MCQIPLSDTALNTCLSRPGGRATATPPAPRAGSPSERAHQQRPLAQAGRRGLAHWFWILPWRPTEEASFRSLFPSQTPSCDKLMPEPASGNSEDRKRGTETWLTRLIILKFLLCAGHRFKSSKWPYMILTRDEEISLEDLSAFPGSHRERTDLGIKYKYHRKIGD